MARSGRLRQACTSSVHAHGKGNNIQGERKGKGKVPSPYGSRGKNEPPRQIGEINPWEELRGRE